MTLAAAAVTMILPVARPDAARTFYSEVLGLPYRGTAADGKLLFDVGSGATLALMEKPAGAQAEHTAISFEHDDGTDSGFAHALRGLEYGLVG